MVEPVRPQMTV